MMPTELTVQDHVFHAMHLYLALCAKGGGGIAATSGRALLQLPLFQASPPLSHWALTLGCMLTSTVHGFPTEVHLLLTPITPDQSLRHRA